MGYIDAMLWSTAGEIHPKTGEELSNLMEFETSLQLKDEAWNICLNFYDKNKQDCLLFVDQHDSDLDLWECLGHDLWLTSAGHGVGFWDRGLDDLGDRLTKACEHLKKDAYLGDDKLVYLA